MSLRRIRIAGLSIAIGISYAHPSDVLGQRRRASAGITHPTKDIDALSVAIDADARANTLFDILDERAPKPHCKSIARARTARTKLNDDGGIFKVFVDARGVVRKVIWAQPSEEHGYFVRIYYDPAEHPRLVAAVKTYVGEQDDSLVLYRTYLDEHGATLRREPRREDRLDPNLWMKKVMRELAQRDARQLATERACGPTRAAD